ncbi:MAG: hypothetical protein ACRDK7_07690 [Solirubrobacteraceae bacterium]
MRAPGMRAMRVGRTVGAGTRPVMPTFGASLGRAGIVGLRMDMAYLQ